MTPSKEPGSLARLGGQLQSSPSPPWNFTMTGISNLRTQFLLMTFYHPDKTIQSGNSGFFLPKILILLRENLKRKTSRAGRSTEVSNLSFLS
jgi:hypothetical protein